MNTWFTDLRCRMDESHTEILVIGAGPTGLFIAGELARHGVRPRIIEMALKPHTQTRATEIQPAVLEVLHRSMRRADRSGRGPACQGARPTATASTKAKRTRTCKLHGSILSIVASSSKHLDRDLSPDLYHRLLGKPEVVRDVC